MRPEHWWNNYVGIRFKALGRDRLGCDCWGLVRMVCAEVFGIPVPDYADEYLDPYDRTRVPDHIDRAKADFAAVSKGAEREGDIICLFVAGKECHVGIVTEIGYMLHLMDGTMATVEQYTARRWSHRVEGFYRYEPKPR